MPLTNYFNPMSFKPQEGGLGMTSGYDYQMDRQRFAEMSDLQKLMIQHQLALENENLIRGVPERQAQRQANTAKYGLEEAISRGTDPSIMVSGKHGAAQSQAATGKFDLGTVEGRISSTNAGNRTKTLEDEARTLEFLATQGPLAVAEHYKRFRQGAPAWVGLPEVYDASVPARLKQINQILVNNPAQKRALDLEDRKGEWDLKKQKLANEGQLNAAKARAAARARSLMEEFNRAKLEEKLSIGAQILAIEDLDEGTRRQVSAAMEAARRAIAARADRSSWSPNDLNDPNAPGNRVLDRLNQPGTGQPQPQYVPGQVYPGRSGKYRYKGGDVKNPKNWEKVQ